MILLILVVLLLLAYFGFNLRSIVNSPTFQDNWSFIENGAVNFWNNYLKKPADYIWNTIFVPLIWRPAVSNLEQMKAGQANSIASSSPTLPQAVPSSN